MEKADNEILKKTLRHYIDLDMYANSVINDIAEEFDDLEDECDAILQAQDYYNTKTGYNIAYQSIKEKVSEFQKSLNDRLEEEAEKVSGLEVTFLAALYGSALKSLSVPLSKILFAPVGGSDTVKTFSERTGKNILRSYDTAARAGYLFGQSSEDIKTSAKRNLAQVKNGMNSGIMTAVPSFAKQTDKIVFLNNNTEVVWCSILDGRTCISCGELHSRHFPSISVAPPQPLHFRCRCVWLRAQDITEPMPTYEEYIDSLPDAEQYHILGKNRYELHKQGLSLERFVNNNYEKLRLDEIDKEIRPMANGQRRSVFEKLTNAEKDTVYAEAKAIGIPTDKIVFRENAGTGYSDERDVVFVSANVFPSNDGSTHNRDNMSIRAVLAHEYYGHRAFRNTKVPQGSWNDEFRASYHAAINAPNLSDADRQSLMRDALDRAKEAGVELTITETIRRILYGY